MKIIIDNDDKVTIAIPLHEEIDIKMLKGKLETIKRILDTEISSIFNHISKDRSNESVYPEMTPKLETVKSKTHKLSLDEINHIKKVFLNNNGSLKGYKAKYRSRLKNSLAKKFNVTPSTIDYWIHHNPKNIKR